MNKPNQLDHSRLAATRNAHNWNIGVMLTIAEVAEILRMHRATVYRLVKRGDLPGFKIGDNWRISEQSLRTVLTAEFNGTAPSLKT